MECEIVRSYWLKTNSAVSKQPVSIVPRCHDGFIEGSQCSPDGEANKAIAVRQGDQRLEGQGGPNRDNLESASWATISAQCCSQWPRRFVW